MYKVARPAVSVIPLKEITENMTHGPDDDAYLEQLQIAIRVVVDDGADRPRKVLDAICGDVHKALLADTKRGGYAANTVKTGVEWGFLDEHYPRAGADVNFLITYATEEKDPTVSSFNS
jgi:hypothetical protein